MTRALRMIAWDVTLQLRHHIFTANLVSTAFICGFILVIPVRPLPASVAAFLIFADPALIGLAFVGALVLMEKAARTHLALGVTPSPPWAYLFSKTATLTVGGTLSGLVVAYAARQGAFDPGQMILALLLSNTVAVVLGFALVARAASMNDLMIKLLYASAVLFLPLIALFDVLSPQAERLLWPVPSMAMLALLQDAIEPDRLTPGGAALACGYLLAWIAAGWIWGLREYRRAVISEGR